MSKQTKIVATLTAFLGSLGLVLVVLLVIPNIDQVAQFARQHTVIAPLILVAWRIFAIVIPPVPGGMLSYALIPVFGWWWSFIWAALAVMIGTSISFFLARHFREPLARRFVPLQQLHRWQDTLSGKTEFFTFLVIRVTTGPVLDFISYVAGLSKISYPKFLVATFIAFLPDAIIYYIGDLAFQQSIYFGLLFLGVVGIFFYIVKKKGFFENADTGN